MKRLTAAPQHEAPGTGNIAPGANQGAPAGSKVANPLGGSRETARGMWCTPKWLADAVGPWDLDPFSNPRSHVVATEKCMLEDGGNGFNHGGCVSGLGWYRVGDRPSGLTSASTRVWLQPPYEIVLQAWRHYRHTRWCALLRFDPSTRWFAEIYAECELVAIPRGRRVNFEPPSGVPASSNAYPHALYYRDARDATDAVLAQCLWWRVNA